MSTKFTNSCAPISYPCTVGEEYINPCTCREYFQCDVSGYDFLRRPCGAGTAWNHVAKSCDTEDKIFIADGTPVCKKKEPWARCRDVSNPYSIPRLKSSCETGSAVNNGGSDSEEDSGSSNDSAAIVGGVLGGILVIVLVAGFVFWWKKRHAKKSDKSLAFRPSIQMQNRGKEDEEVYDVIDEKSIQVVPVVENMAYGKEQPIEYDNPAFSDKSETNAYNNLQQQHPPQQQHRGPAATRPSSTDTNDLEPPKRISSSGSGDNRNHLSTFSREDDLSRSISVGGTDVLVEDSQGYHIGYPSGTIPRQPSMVPPAPGTDDDKSGNEVDYGYDLGKQPLPHDYVELEKTEL